MWLFFQVTNRIYSYSADDEDLKNLVVKYGAVTSALYASDDTFKNYKSGVIDKCRYVLVNRCWESIFLHKLTVHMYESVRQLTLSLYSFSVGGATQMVSTIWVNGRHTSTRLLALSAPRGQTLSGTVCPYPAYF